MTSSNLRDLFDEATSDIPASVAQPPLTAIRVRVSHRRTAYATAGAAAAAIAVVLAVKIPMHVWKAKPEPPAAATAGITWEFGFADGNKLTVYATTLRKCTFLNNPVATTQRAGDSYTIRLIGELDTTSGCATPDANGVSNRTELAQATGLLDHAVPTALIKDAVSGQIRPIYDRSELPVGFAGTPAHGSGWGAQSSNGDPAEFRGSFQAQKVTSPPSGFLTVEFRGLGLSTAPPPIADGEAATYGSINGWLAPGADSMSYRFVWHKPRGDSWITYELFAPGTKAAFTSLLQQLTWP
jgi:hypothetical protein